jgi:hypothetical protein
VHCLQTRGLHLRVHVRDGADEVVALVVGLRSLGMLRRGNPGLYTRGSNQAHPVDG